MEKQSSSASTAAKKRKIGKGKTDRSEEQEDTKPPPRGTSNANEKQQQSWIAVLAQLPRCAAAEGIRETSCFRAQYSVGASAGNTCLKKLLQELGTLEEALPTDPAIWLRYDEETPQFLRVMITAPGGTPYAHGLFTFDMYFPGNYPSVPPKMKLLTTGGGTLRFSPNLYENGTVCLSLLGTWDGPRWNPLHSTILQVLVSVQGLILGVEHPYYLEPGHGGWEGDVNLQGQLAAVPNHVKILEDNYRVGTVKYAMLDTCRAMASHLVPFRDVIAAHFYHYQNDILLEATSWATSMATSLRSSTAKHSLHGLQETIKLLQTELGKLKPPLPVADNDETKVAGDKANGSGSGKMQANGDSDADAALIAAKQRAIEEAAGKGDYVTAGQLQSELLFLDSNTSGKGFKAEIAQKKHEMDEAAKKGDFITAGQLQQRVQYLEKHKKRLQELQQRMFQAAAQQDFVRAGRFQEQYQILLDNDDSSNGASTSGGASKAATNTAVAAALWDQGGGGGIGGVTAPPPNFAASIAELLSAKMGAAAGALPFDPSSAAYYYEPAPPVDHSSLPADEPCYGDY